ncbi:uncharacterized protein LOC116852579 [Odontomachus brunneus]|uniref:uncharacterized protein LOC116852579 n=1 Tax=Odontomachus brunneus TaxID=486640 RepID=UPI0013F203D8|nr:uncharacterized protein LOC116852579 [Odontomachus brunneus]
MASITNQISDVEGGGGGGKVPEETGDLQPTRGEEQSCDGIEGSRPPYDCHFTEAITSLAEKEGEDKAEEGAMMPSADYEGDTREDIDPLEINMEEGGEAIDITQIVASQAEDTGKDEVAEKQVDSMVVETVVVMPGNSQPPPPRKRKKEGSISPGEEEARWYNSEEDPTVGTQGRKVQAGVKARRGIPDNPESERETETKRTRPKDKREDSKAAPTTSGRSIYLKDSESEAVTVSSEEEYMPNTRATARKKAKAGKKRRKVEPRGKDQKETESDRSREGRKLIKGVSDMVKETTRCKAAGRQEGAKEGNPGANKAAGRQEGAKEGNPGANKGTKGQLSQRKGNSLDKDDTPDADNREESVVLGPLRYNKMTAASAGALALEWLDEIEECRFKSSNMQGRVSGHIKSNVVKIKDLVKSLVGRAEATGDPLYLRMRNSELSMQIQNYKETCERNEADLSSAKRTIQELKKAMPKADGRKHKTGTKSKMEEESKERGRGNSSGNEDPAQGGDPDTEVEPMELGKEEGRCEDVVWRPQLNGTSVPIPSTASKQNVSDVGKERVETITRQIAELVKVRRQLRKDRSLDKKGNNVAATERARNSGRAEERQKPAGLRISSDIQLVPPRAKADPCEDIPLSEREGKMPADKKDGDWVTVGKGKGKRPQPQQKRVATMANEEEVGAVLRKNEARRRPPKTAAVTITGRAEGFSYANVLRKAREKISLAGIGIEQSKIRRAINGGILMEIMGPDGRGKAEALVAKLKEALQDDGVVVTRPVVKGEIRIIGLDDSVTCEEVRDVVASSGNCTPEEVRTGDLRKMSNGLSMIWVQCPLAAATLVAKGEKIRIGWTIARVELLRARPLQCFRCWEYGHVMNACKSTTDRSAACYRCGMDGHCAKQCTTAPKCMVCTERGGDGKHRMGSWEAYNLLIHQAAELETDLCVIAEPPAAPEAGNWYRSDNGLAAVVWRSKGSARLGLCSLVKRGHDFVIVEAGGVRIASCYVSPQTKRGPFLQFLDELGEAVREIGVTRIIVAGDFNARSRTWDKGRPNARGDLLEEWAAENDVRILNVGREPTCVRPQGCSVVDTTWGSPDLAAKAEGWRVLDFRSTKNSNRGKGGYDRWKLSKLDVEVFQALWELRCEEDRIDGDVDKTAADTAAWLQRTMKEACDLAAPRASKGRARRRTYWWNQEIAEVRRACIKVRRILTRKAKKKDAGFNDESKRELAKVRKSYRECTDRMRKLIRVARKNAWHELIATIEADPWGTPYRLVLGKMRNTASRLTETLEEETVDRLIDALFPAGRLLDDANQDIQVAWRDCWKVSTVEVRAILENRGAKNRAPGIDGFTAGIWKKVPNAVAGKVAECLTICLREGTFPVDWKRAILVLIPKGSPPSTELMPKVRPICLLNEIGKVLERVIANRMLGWMRENPMADLADNQYGFREGRSTCDAIIKVQNVVTKCIRNGEYAIGISLDIKNAFNSIPWVRIHEALEKKGFPNYIRKIVAAYLSDRWIEYGVTGGGTKRRAVRAGVPQGSVLGPLLWNVVYDGVLRSGIEEGL